ncbi:MAG: DUF6350 family protein [bacterium]
MTEVVARPGAPERREARAPDAPAPLPLVVAGALAGVAAAGLGLVLLGMPVLLAWLLAPDIEEPWFVMVEVAAGAWLAGQGLPPRIDGVVITLLPYGLGLAACLMLFLAGRWAARASSAARPVEALVVAVSGALAYGACAAVVAALARGVAVPPTRALATTAAIAAVTIAWGACTTPALRGQTVGRLPAPVRASAAAAGITMSGLLVAGCVLLLVGLLLHAAQVGVLVDLLVADLSSAILVAGLSLGYLPNLIAWSMATVLGTGVQASGVALESAALPAFPPLAALPVDLPGSFALPLLAVAAGMLGGAALRRRGMTGGDGILAGLGASALVGATTVLLVQLSSGALGTDRLAHVGPDPVMAGAWAAGLALGGMLVVAAWPSRRTGGDGDG